MYLVDSHTHLDFVEDLESALARAQEAGVEKIITVAIFLVAAFLLWFFDFHQHAAAFFGAQWCAAHE